jgi:alpha-beta hydrolase superfamily lysophospholipase
MHHETGSFQSADGLTLFTRRWAPDGGARAVVGLVHGIHEHSGRYAYPASLLMARGYEVRALDLRGHGRSEGERAMVERFEDYVADVHAFVQQVREDAGGRPVILMGHSMGGLVAAATVVEHGMEDLAGLVLSSPALRVPAPPVLRALSPLVARWLPRLPTTGVDLTRLSRDPVVGRTYAEDPLNTLSGVRARLGYEILRTADRVAARPDAFTGPLYLFHGTDDRLTDPEGSRRLAETAASPDVTLRLWEGLRHETMNEPERDAVLGALADWLDAHTDDAAVTAPRP